MRRSLTQSSRPSVSGARARWRDLGQGEAGVAAVEFALVLPLFLMLVLGMIDYGYFFLIDMACTTAAREGARRGAVQKTASGAATSADAAAAAYLSAVGLNTGLNVPTIPATAQPAAGSQYAVSVSCTVASFTPLIGFVPTPPSLSVTSQMRWEWAP